MEDAFKSFKKCADLGDAESARYLGIMYLRGKGISKNVDEALRWLEVAAKRGDDLAEKNLLSLRKIMKK
jgi:TPR repeat protein